MRPRTLLGKPEKCPQGRSTLMPDFLNLITGLGFCERTALFLGETPSEVTGIKGHNVGHILWNRMSKTIIICKRKQRRPLRAGGGPLPAGVLRQQSWACRPRPAEKPGSCPRGGGDTFGAGSPGAESGRPLGVSALRQARADGDLQPRGGEERRRLRIIWGGLCPQVRTSEDLNGGGGERDGGPWRFPAGF